MNEGRQVRKEKGSLLKTATSPEVKQRHAQVSWLFLLGHAAKKYPEPQHTESFFGSAIPNPLARTIFYDVTLLVKD